MIIDKYESAAERAVDSTRRFKLYEDALEICRRHDFIQREARIHCKLAEFTLKSGDFKRAMQEADFSINKDPDYLKVYCLPSLKQLTCRAILAFPFEWDTGMLLWLA